jgi:membrane-associated phospholipid phosphatase
MVPGPRSWVPSPTMTDLSYPATPAEPTRRSHHGGKINDTWPLHKRQFAQLGIAYVALTALFVGIGKLITGPLEDSPVTRADQRLEEWFEARRTPTWNSLSLWGSSLAETWVKVLVTSIIVMIFLRMWRRWFEAALIAVALIIEALTFITVTMIVGRPRPDVEKLDGSPVGSSFPSGHVAAAVAYAAIAVIIFRHTRNRLVRSATVIVCVLTPILVGLSRMYRGMHFLSDVTAGMVLGAACVYVTVRIFDAAPEGREPQVRPLDRAPTPITDPQT